jgi:glycosyltransferase involved in cell wall biosynthesis
VPTKSTFAEGFAKSVAEAILAGRPVITSPVTPAFDTLRSACIEARTDDVPSYTDAILRLLNNDIDYYALTQACRILQETFYDRNNGFTAVLKQALEESTAFVTC